MRRLKIFLIILGIIIVLVGAGFLVNRSSTKGETQKFIPQNATNSNYSYYWTITKNRTSLKGALPDQLQVFSPDNKLVFDSDSVKPIVPDTEKPKITITAKETEDGMDFKQIFSYSFAEVNVTVTLSNSQKYADITSEIKYTQDKASQFEGIELGLANNGIISYFDETFTKKPLVGKVQISQWSPHIIEVGSKYKATLTDNSAEVMELQKGLNQTAIKFFSYYGPTRNNVYDRDFTGEAKAEPKIDINIKRAKGEVVKLIARLFVGQDPLSYLPFRYPYAMDSVVSFVSHADFGTILDVVNEGTARLRSVFYGSSDPSDPTYGKKGILAHHLRVSFMVWPLMDSVASHSTNGSTLESPLFLAVIQDLFRHGIDIGAHRLTSGGVGDYQKQATAKIAAAFNLMAQFSPTIWVDHHVRDCSSDPTQENIAACGSIAGNKLNVLTDMVKGTWQYLWASGQDSQAGSKDYSLSAFEDFQSAARILYYYQGAFGAEIPVKLLTFSSSSAYENKTFSTKDLDKLATDKGFNNIHAYFMDNSIDLNATNPKKDNQNNIYWQISNHLENEFKLLESYQDENKVWVEDFTTVADYLQTWHNIKILDFTNNSITIKNEGENAIDGLTLYSSSGKIATAKSGDTYYPYIRDNYVVLSKLGKGETRTIEFGSDASIPQITNFTDKHIEISDASYLSKDKKLVISIAPSGKPGQDLVIGDTDITIKLPNSISPKIIRDGVSYTNFNLKDKVLTITTDTKAHNFEIQL